MGAKLKNNAYGTLIIGISASDVTITLAANNGARFPTLSAGEYFYATLVDTTNNLEIVKVTARAADVLTVVRGQDGTTARAYLVNDRIEQRMVTALFNEKLDASVGYGDTTNPYVSKTAKFVLAAPNAANGLPTFRALVASDIPTLNQNTTGTASSVSGTVAILNGGTGATTAPNALSNLGAYPATNPSGFTNNTGTVTSVAASAGTGISVTGSPITASGTLNIINTAPDQVVSLTGAGTTTVTGTYPNFTVTSSGGVSSVTGTAPVTSTGGATPAISMAAATTSVNGYLTSADWNTFNGKQAALGFTPYNSTNPSNYIALGSAITGYTAGANTALAATDTLLAGLGKIQGQINARGTGNGTVTSVGITSLTGVTVSNSPITTSGNITVGLSTKLTAIENLSGAGFFTQNGSGAIASRTIQQGTGITVAHGNGSSQDPEISIDSTVATLTGTQTLTNKTLTAPRIGTGVFDTNGAEVLNIVSVASAVNELSISNAATGGDVLLTTAGDDTNIDLLVQTKGAGAIIFDTGIGVGQIDLKAGVGNVRFWDDDSSHYYQFVTGDRTSNININLPVGDVTLSAGTTVVTTRSILTTAPLTGGGNLTTNRTISMTQSSDTVNGWLSSTDWTTFNNKLSTQVYPSVGIPNSTGSAWGTSYSVTGTGNVVLSASPTLTGTVQLPLSTFNATNTTIGNTATNITIGQPNTDVNNTITIGNITTSPNGGSFSTINIGASYYSDIDVSGGPTITNILGDCNFDIGAFVTFGSGTFSSGLTVAGILNTSGQFTLRGSTNANQLLASNATTGNLDIHTAATSGSFTIGGVNATGAITIGRSTQAQTVNIATGATATSRTKAVNIGTNGVSGSTTNIIIGATAGTSTTTVQGYFKPPALASAPTYVKGAVYFDTTLNKLRVGGATTWETITSA